MRAWALSTPAPDSASRPRIASVGLLDPSLGMMKIRVAPSQTVRTNRPRRMKTYAQGKVLIWVGGRAQTGAAPLASSVYFAGLMLWSTYMPIGPAKSVEMYGFVFVGQFVQ